MNDNVIILKGNEEKVNTENSVIADSMMDGYHGIEKRLIGLEVPDETTHYKPIPYKRLIDETMESLDKNGFKVVSRRYQTNRAMDVAMGFYDIEGPDAPFGHQIAWLNSYNKSRSVAFVTGMSVWICGNGLMSGDEVFKQKHIGAISHDLREEMQRQIDGMGNKYDRLLTDIEAMQHVELNRREIAELAGRLFIEEEVITPTQMSTLKKQILEPSFDYSYGHYDFKNNDLYSLYQHGTYTLKSSSPYNNVENLSKWHKAITGFMN